jgi:hypothetical protein
MAPRAVDCEEALSNRNRRFRGHGPLLQAVVHSSVANEALRLL